MIDMCIILDINQWGDFLSKKDDMKPIHDWLKKRNGKLIYSNHKDFKELKPYRRKLEEYKRSGQSREANIDKVENEIQKIDRSLLQSDDIHILGLAKAEGVKILCTRDKKLHKDFKEIIGGNIYQKKEHQDLLTADICP